MLEYVKGLIDDLTPATATIDCNGVGYLCNISLNTYSALDGKKEAKLYVYEAIREDAWVLFGFATKKERELFLLLISVSGVGGNTARTMLSSFSPAELAMLIMEGNEKLIKTVKGLGAKTAQRIIVELRDKVTALAMGGDASAIKAASEPAPNSEVYNEAFEALKILGYPPAPAAKAIKAILKDKPDAKVEEVIRMGLKML